LTVPDSNSSLNDTAAQKRKAPESEPIKILSGSEENLEAL
jgi:hypothetical protein